MLKQVEEKKQINKFTFLDILVKKELFLIISQNLSKSKKISQIKDAKPATLRFTPITNHL